MTRIAKKLLLPAAMLLPAMAFGQLRAAADTVAFGRIYEADGPKTVRAFVRNEGATPVALLKVRPTCGCTAADFMKEEVAPGDSAWIDLTYDPVRRPGYFEKSVKIYPTEGDMVRVAITGTVFASPETAESMFPVDAGALRLSQSTLMTLSPMGTDQRTLYIDAYNADDSPVWLRLESDSEAVDTQPFPSPLPPGEKGLIGVYIDPRKEPRSGKLEYNLLLHTADNPGFSPSTQPFPIKLYSEKQQ